MRLIPISEVLQMDDKELIRAVSGVVTKIYPAKRGQGANGPWAIQNGAMKDGSGTEIPFVIVDREDEADDMPKNWKGRKVIFEAFHGEKGYSGVYAYDDTYDPTNSGKITKKIRVTKTGQFYLEGDAPAQGHHEEEPPSPRQQQSQQRTPPAPQAPTAKQPPADSANLTDHQKAVGNTKRELARLANLYCLCLEVVDAIIVPKASQMNEELYQSAVSSMFISTRDKGFHQYLPLKLQPAPPPPQPKPEPPPPPKPEPPRRPPSSEPDDDEIPF